MVNKNTTKSTQNQSRKANPTNENKQTRKETPEPSEKFVSSRHERVKQRLSGEAAPAVTKKEPNSEPAKESARPAPVRPKSNSQTPAAKSPHKQQNHKKKVVITGTKVLKFSVGLAVVALAFLFIYNITQPENTVTENESVPEQTQSSPEVTTGTQQKSPLDLAKDNANQNLSAVGNILQDSSFSEDNVVKLAVPPYSQVFAQSCEAAALRMALAYRDVNTTDLEILQIMNFDDKPAEKIDGQWHWGDPHKMFVGFKDGSQVEMTGYGVFAEPIAAAAESKGRATEIANDVKPDWIARQIYAGNPVVLWGTSVKIADAKWITPDGTEINAPMRTHTRLVIGVKGDLKNPEGFYINDPAGGKAVYWTTKQLTDNTAAGIGQAVAIF